MKIAVVGHSLAHVRQQKFFEQVAKLGHLVRLYCPDAWSILRPKPYSWDRLYDARFSLYPLPTIGAPDMYHYRLPGLSEALTADPPDVLYIQQEVACAIVPSCLELAGRLGARAALFVWENLHAPSEAQQDHLRRFDLVVCGNDRAYDLHAAAKRRVILPQVGVDTDHFCPRPGLERSVNVGFFGRPVPEKGIHYLESAWPTAKITTWSDWTRLPWPMSTVKVAVCYSQDTAVWNEQAMPYVAVEAMACECSVVVSDAGAIPFWLRGEPGDFTPGDPAPVFWAKQGSVEELREAIAAANTLTQGPDSRAWVVKHLSSPVIGKRLMEELDAVVEEEGEHPA